MLISSIIKYMFLLFLLILLTVGTWLLLPTAALPSITTLSTPTSKLLNWQSILDRPKPLNYKLIHAGDIQMDRNQLLQGAPEQWADRYKELPVLSHWVQHPIHGEILIDAAFSTHFKHSTSGNYARFMAFFAYLTGVSNTLDQDLISQLPNNGTDIKQMFITHFHPDHTSGIAELPLDMPIAADIKEYDIFSQLVNGDLFERRPHWQGLDFAQGVEILPFKRVIDIYGDASILAISTPGHTRGHTSYLINSDQGAKLIVGDASHFEYGFNNNLPPAAIGDENRRLAEDSLSQLTEFSKLYPQVEMILGHEIP